ncbi:sigma-70 family RNA polymerase sigma factor [Aquisphaera insulae]|uniref:sigma-70 family RNA polymerase sigma factor n=1 Tax=Aquisphaera insulae TaxID=2712864 RepID=UPI0013EDEA29|nr:sigma-70 family RNA polymerase sigma factor [Aquisphaera insulae]
MSPNELDEIAFARLLASARMGNNPALGELLERYRNYLSLLARVQIGRQLQGKLDVADVVQEAFLAAHRAIGQFRGINEAQLLAWLRQILVAILANQVRKYVGTRRRDVTLERELQDHVDQSSAWLGPNLASPQSSPSAQASRREQAVLLADAMESLPADYREVIILRQLEGLSFPDVARRMGRTEDSVKNLWARALVRLRRSLNALEES